MKNSIAITLLLMVVFFMNTASFSQNIGISDVVNTPAASAVLDVYSTTKGLLAPRMTAAQRTAISSPATGLLVYQTDATAGFYYYNGATWALIANSATGNWSTTGNSGTTAGTNFVGTTDAVDLVLKTNATEKVRIKSAGDVAIGTSTFDATNPEQLLVESGTTTSVNAIVGKGTIDNYFQLNIQNKSTGTSASSDVVATADNGNESANFIDMGINGSGYTGAVVGNANDAYLYSVANNLLLGSASSSKDIIFFTNGTNAYTNERMRIKSSGNIGIGTTSPATKFHLGSLTVNTEGFRMQDGTGSVGHFIVNANPNGVVTGTRGSIAQDYTNGTAYVNTNGATAWSALLSTNTSLPLITANGTTTATTEVRNYNTWVTRGSGFYLTDVAAAISNPIPNEGAWFALSQVAQNGSYFGQTSLNDHDYYFRGESLSNLSTSIWYRMLRVPATSQTKINIDASNNATLMNADNGFLAFGTNNTEKVRVTTAGDVGVGITVPTAKLSVAAGTTTNANAINATGSINDFFQYDIKNTSTGTSAQSGYSATANNGTSTTMFSWVGINNSTFTSVQPYNIGVANDVQFLGAGNDMHIANNNTSKDIIFSTGKAASPYFNERLRIKNSGDVGIGSSTFDATYPEQLLVDAGTTSSVNAIVGKGTVNNYLQLNIQNKSTGNSASSDVVATADNGNESANYIDMGINGSGYTGGVVGNANDAYLYSIANNLLIGSAAANKDVVFFTNGSNAYTNERMRVTSAGNVGIGISTPNAPLQFAATTANRKIVLWQSINDDHQFYGMGINNNVFRFQVDGTASGNYAWYAATSSSASNELMRLSGTGNLGIGTTATRGKVEINGSQNTTIAYGWLNAAGAVGTNGSASVQTSLYASARVACSEINVFSDARIKSIKGLSDNCKDLETLRSIEVTDYTFIDSIAKGTGLNKKVIAQQVEKIYPQAVSKRSDVIPNIYKRASIANGMVSLATDLKAGDKVKLIFADREELIAVTEVNTNSFKVNAPDSGFVFVYGKEVNDFRAVDYEAIAMLNVSATQELAKQNQLLLEELATLKKEKGAQQVQLDTQSKLLDTLKKENVQANQYITEKLNVLEAKLELLNTQGHISAK